MREGRAFSGEKEEVSKSITVWYWPWWKALWMLTSSGQISQLFVKCDMNCSVPPSAENGSIVAVGVVFICVVDLQRMRTPYAITASRHMIVNVSRSFPHRESFAAFYTN